MKLETINLQLVKNIGNYETIRLGGEWSVDKSETLYEALHSARVALEDAFVEMQQQRAKEQAYTEAQSVELNPKGEPKERLIFGTAKYQSVIDKVRDGITLETVKEWYVMTEKDEQIIKLQSKL